MAFKAVSGISTLHAGEGEGVLTWSSIKYGRHALPATACTLTQKNTRVLIKFEPGESVKKTHN